MNERTCLCTSSYWKHCPECYWKIKVFSRTETYYCPKCAGDDETGPMVKLVDGYD